jgi:ketosteroid isomerase-like protein
MSNFRILLCCAVLLCSFFGCKTQPPPADRAEDERAIRELETEASKAIADKDLDRLVSLYADGAALFYADSPMVAGKDAIRQTWKSIFARPGFAMSAGPLKVVASGSGGLGFSRGFYSMTTKDANGRPLTDTGEYVVVYKKLPDGRWKIIADSGSADLRVHSVPKSPDRRQQPASQIAPLIGLVSLLSGFGFLFGMPVIAAAFAWKCYRSRKLPRGLPVAIAMVLVFWLAATQLWRHFAAHYWNMSFMTALQAAGDAAQYGHPIEHTAEVLVVNLLIFSTLLAVAAGAITLAVQHLWTKRRRPAA